jgi:Ni,Fe-hydrogenase maturation factor
MSYGVAAALQAAVYQRLSGIPGVAVYDAVPPGGAVGTFVLIGPEDVREASDKTAHGAEHRLVVSVVTDEAGFQSAKAVAVAVSDALVDAEMVLTRGMLVSMAFLRAVARRVSNGAGRRIDLTFRARVED